MKKRFLLVLAIAVSFLILTIGHSAIAQRPTPATTTARSKSIYRLHLNQEDAYLMTGAARCQWEHRVMPVGMQGSGRKSFIMSYKG